MASETESTAGGDWAPVGDLRTDIPHPARMYDFYLGGKDNFPADRAAAAKVVELFPDAPTGSRANRRFLGRAVACAAQRGIRRFLDIGTGIPTAGNTHEVAQRIAPDAQVVYVDNDPIVLAHARALLRGTPEGRTAYVDADFHDPGTILAAAPVAQLLAAGEPVAVLTVALLHFFPDDQDPAGLLKQVKDVLPDGSMLILSHGTGDFLPPETKEQVMGTYAKAGLNMVSRSREEVAEFFSGMRMLEPGIVPVHEWRSADSAEDRAMTRAQAAGWAGVAVKGGDPQRG